VLLFCSRIVAAPRNLAHHESPLRQPTRTIILDMIILDMIILDMIILDMIILDMIILDMIILVTTILRALLAPWNRRQMI
jgi:hypothetical protein